MRGVVAIAIVIACGARVEPAPSSPMQPIDRYHDYLRRLGVRPETTHVSEDGALQLGGFHFYRDDGGTMRAAVSATGLVGGRRDAGDAWWELLGAGDAGAIADRIAWLASSPDRDRHRRGSQVVVVRPHDRAPAAIDPAAWHVAALPVLRSGPDLRVLTMWTYTTTADEPMELVIRARPDKPAEFVERAASSVAALGDPIARATAALAGNDDAAIAWALLVLPRKGATAAAPAIAKLLRSGDPDRRAEAASALATLASPAGIEPLGTAARTETDATALTAELQALGHVHSAAAARMLVELRRVIHAPERVEIVHALAKIGSAATAEVRLGLTEASTKDPDAEIRDLAASYLRDVPK